MIKFNFQGLRPKKDEIETYSKDDFKFTEVQPDMDRLVEIAGKYGKTKNLIILARGGSISSFRAFWQAQGMYISDKNVYFVDTIDPDYTFYVKDRCMAENSLVIAISKSGTTVDVLENVMSFWDYPMVMITSEGDNPLNQIAKKMSFDIVVHPEIGGRYSGLSEVALLPAMICGLDVSEIRRGAKEAYAEFQKPKNYAKSLALIVKDLSDEGYDQIFWPIYSKKLASFYEIISQLISESVAKEGKGITVLPAEGPESQHYLNQRFFGGPKNMIGIFTTVSNFEEDQKVKAAEEIKDIALKDINLSALSGIPLSKDMHFELQGSLENAKNKKIPAVLLEIDKVDEYNLGYFLAFLHIFTVYLSRAFEVNPFDQPEVEAAKKISFEARKNYKK